MVCKKDETENTLVLWRLEAVEWLQDMKDPQEFMESLKIDLFEDEVFVFTPKGDVKALPTGSTPVDFAFDVHTDIGLRCIGAKVNGKIQPLDYQLKNGEFVEILTSKTANPSQDWLSFVKTSKARNKIRSWLKEEQRDVSVMRGREQLEKELKKHNLEIKEYLAAKKLTDTAKRYGYSNPDDLFASIGFGRINANQVVQKLAGKELEERRRDRQLNRSRQPRHREAKGVAIKGVDNLLVRFSKCCTPVPGDEIVGYVTRGRGVSIHRTDCPNVQSLSQDSGRQIEVAWNTSEKESFPVDLELKAVDRMNMLSAIMNTIAEGQTNIEAVNTRKLKDDIALILLTVDIYNLEHMQALINRLRQVDGVVSVRRATPT